MNPAQPPVEPAASAPTYVLRPVSATVIPVLTWALVAYFVIDAVWKGGYDSLWNHGPFLLLASVAAWVVLWAPRLIVYGDRVEMRNILHTYTAKFGAIEKVGIGAMVSMIVRTASGTTRTVTAWNAPGVGRDRPADRLSTMKRHEPSVARQGNLARRAGPGERLRQDQEKATSFVLYERWERWWDRHEAEQKRAEVSRKGRAPKAGTEAADEQLPVLETRYNVPQIIALLVSAALVVLTLAI
ncbi:MAG: hypothetical protein Q4G21_08500 [Dermabacter sp.]|nr:hypothetical protein [Dermabacter sp.]